MQNRGDNFGRTNRGTSAVMSVTSGHTFRGHMAREFRGLPTRKGGKARNLSHTLARSVRIQDVVGIGTTAVVTSVPFFVFC